jgi:hypothetical protein
MSLSSPQPTRTCGACTVCCKHVLIDDPDFQKAAGILCPSCKEGKGCQIYAMRPAPCRGFECGWKTMPDLPDELRPDRSGILIRFIQEHIPPGLAPVGLTFLVYDNRTDMIGPGFAGFLGRHVAQNVAVFLSVRGPPGYSDGAVLLNQHLAPALGDPNKMANILRDILAQLANNRFEPYIFKYGKRALNS